MLKKMLSKRGVTFLTLLIGSILCTLLFASTLTESSDDPGADKTVSSFEGIFN